jgi:phasin family protein
MATRLLCSATKEFSMSDVISQAAAASDKVIDAVTDMVETASKPAEAVAEQAPAAAKLARVAAKPVAAKPVAAKAPAKRTAKPRIAAPSAPVVEAIRKVNRKAATTVAKRKYVRKAVAAAKPVASPVSPTLPTATPSNPYSQGLKIMDSTNWFAGFTSVPGADKFQTLFAGAGEKSQEVVRKGQAFAETLTETARANMEAVVESSKIAAAGARDLGTEIVATTKAGVEQTTAAVKTLAEAKSPTEFFQLQSEMMKASFDRFVAEGSKLTEQMVKLAGEASQPLSNRASVNAEKFSELTA